MSPHNCPQCDSVHDTAAGVVQHMFMTKDDDHPDNKGDCWQIILAESDKDDISPPDNHSTESTGKLNPEMPGTDKNGHQPDPDTVDCPNCGMDLNHSQEEIETFIRDHGAAFCDECGFELKVKS